MWSFISALAEPVGAIIAWLIVGDGLNPFIEGLMFGIVSGMMVTISFKELIPNTSITDERTRNVSFLPHETTYIVHERRTTINNGIPR